MSKALEFLQESGTFYVATTEGDQPRVRPFGAAFEYEGKLYIATNNTKKCFKQMWKTQKLKCPAWIKKVSGFVFPERLQMTTDVK